MKTPAKTLVPATLKSGWGFNVSQDFARATKDTPCLRSPSEDWGPHTVAYIDADPAAKLGFLRFGGADGKIRITSTPQAFAEPVTV